MRLLIVEDDADLAAALAGAFDRRGIDSDLAHSAEEARLMLESLGYAAAVVDLGLPDADGMEVIRALRERGDAMPVIILTARSDVASRVKGLNAGADDYLVKPFEFEELQARLDAVLRRQSGYQGRKLVAGNLAFDIMTREVAIDGRAISLSQRETDFLELLLRRPGRVVPKRLAEDQLFGMSESFGSNAIEVYAHRLRRRLSAEGADIRINTVRGIGYILMPA